MAEHILALKRAYGATCPPSSLSSVLLSHSDSYRFQDELVESLLFAPHFRDFPPSRDFRRLFWKWIAQNLEEHDEEVDERIYEAYLDLISEDTFPPRIGLRPPSPSYNTHFWSSSSDGVQNIAKMRTTTLLESRTMIEGGTTGLRTWNASFRLAEWLVSHADVVQARNVLELGSGAGFLGLIIAALQLDQQQANPESSAPNLVLTDVNPEVLSRCRNNFQLSCNSLHTHQSLDFRLLDWSEALNSDGSIDLESALKDVLRGVDIIVGADVVYDSTIVPALVAALALFFHAKGSLPRHDPSAIGAYIALTIRREDTISAFLSVLSYHRLNYEEIDLGACSQTQFLARAEGGVESSVKLVRVLPSR